ncbi:unnamed protein product [Symbiodinium natans]|uniref:Uncharacterized protein n=1 Tax=Symbiodinium natans TaxID=878477 RepID=A0A812I0F1_9DINO|nr:unnamed protein product [Symbiodinium natans]
MGNTQYRTKKVDSSALVLHNVQDDPGWMRWYEKQAIAGDMVWDRDALGGMSPPSGGPCGLEAFDWVLQAAVHLKKIREPGDIDWRWALNGTGDHELRHALDQTDLGYKIREGLRFDQVDPHLREGKPVMVCLCHRYRWSDGDTGKLHWIVLNGFVNNDENWYWFVSNGSIPGIVGADAVKFLVNKNIGKPFELGAYINNRVILVDW